MANMLFIFLLAAWPRMSYAQVGDFKLIFLDSAGNAVTDKSTPVNGIQFEFTTSNAGTTTGSLNLPPGFLSAGANSSSFSVDNGTSASFPGFTTITVAPTTSPTGAPTQAPTHYVHTNETGNASSSRRLSAGCEVTSATVNGANLDLTLQAPGGGACPSGSTVQTSITGSSATFSSLQTGALSFGIVTNADPAQAYVSMTVAPGGSVALYSGAWAVTYVSASLTSVDTNVGTVPTAIQFKFTPTTQIPNGGTIDIVASQDLWAASAGSPTCTVTQSGLTVAGTSAAVNALKTSTRISVGATVITAGNEVTIACGGGPGFDSLGPITGGVTFTFQTSVDTSPVTSAAAYSVVGLATASDPITFYNGEKIKFWLPHGRPVLILETPDLKIHARAFQGPTDDLQWFDSLIVTLPSGSKVVEVATKRTRPRVRRNATGPVYRQLDVYVGESKTALESAEDRHIATLGGEVRLSLEARPHSPPRVHKEHLVEYVHVETDCVTFMIFASHAGNEFKDDVRLQEQYRHVDLNFLDIKCLESYSGPLPELWGLKPRSPQVEEMLVPPSERSSSRTDSQGARVCSGGEATCAAKRITS